MCLLLGDKRPFNQLMSIAHLKIQFNQVIFFHFFDSVLFQNNFPLAIFVLKCLFDLTLDVFIYLYLIAKLDLGPAHRTLRILYLFCAIQTKQVLARKFAGLDHYNQTNWTIHIDICIWDNSLKIIYFDLAYLRRGRWITYWQG